MSKRQNAKYKISRSLGVNLWGTAGDSIIKKNYPPGQHGPNLMRKVSYYGSQLRAKQRLRKYYNISEKQFRNIFDLAVKRRGDKSENFIGLLESRLDALVYRANFVPTIFAARQFVSHKHVLVNGKKVNIPSYRLSAGDVIEIREKSRDLAIVIESLEKMERTVPAYLELDKSARKLTFIAVPKFAEVPFAAEMEPNLIVEFYSR